MTPDVVIQLENERHQYIETVRSVLGTWGKSVGKTVGTNLAAPLRTFSYAQAGANSAKDRINRERNDSVLTAGAV